MEQRRVNVPHALNRQRLQPLTVLQHLQRHREPQNLEVLHRVPPQSRGGEVRRRASRPRRTPEEQVSEELALGGVAPVLADEGRGAEDGEVDVVEEVGGGDGGEFEDEGEDLGGEGEVGEHGDAGRVGLDERR